MNSWPEVKVKLSIYRSTYVSNLSCGQKASVITARKRWWIQTDKMSFLWRVAGFRDRGRSNTQKELGVELLLLCSEKSQLGLFRGITYHSWARSALRSPSKRWRMWLRRRTSGLPCLVCCHHDLDLNKRQMDKRMDRMDGYLSWHFVYMVHIPIEMCLIKLAQTKWHKKPGS